MFKVQVFKTVWAGSIPESRGFHIEYPDCTPYEYEIELSFAPFVGLEIINDAERHHFMSGPIRRVAWFEESKSFACWVDDEFPHTHGDYQYSYEWLKDRAAKTGWEEVG